MKIPFGTPVVAAYQSRYEPESAQALARMYWSMLLVLFALTLVASIGYGYWQFSRPLAAQEGGATVSAPKAVLHRDELQAVLDGFDARAQKFDERRSGPAVADPSI